MGGERRGGEEKKGVMKKEKERREGTGEGSPWSDCIQFDDWLYHLVDDGFADQGVADVVVDLPIITRRRLVCAIAGVDLTLGVRVLAV